MSNSYYIGIDGGGSKTEAVIGTISADNSPVIIGSGIAGPSNLQSHTAEMSAARCIQAIEQAWNQAAPSSIDRSTATLTAICCCMAGAGSLPHKQAFEHEIRRLIRADNHLVTHDALPLLATHPTKRTGIALIAGTGSFAYGRTESGRELRCGGWGGLFGDEGSSYDLAIEGVRRASQAVDRRGPETELVNGISNWLNTENPTQWLPILRSYSSMEIAQGSAVISRCAENGDPVALAILDAGSVKLANHISTLADQLFPSQEFDLALAGGLILNNQYLKTQLLSQLYSQRYEVAELFLIPQPAFGALNLAMDNKLN